MATMMTQRIEAGSARDAERLKNLKRTCWRCACLGGRCQIQLSTDFAGPSTMDPWKEYAAREECRDVVRQWAELEGKSPQMSDDLVKRYAKQVAGSLDKSLAITAGVRAIAWAIHMWWHITRR
jgi:hypothetical protein